MSRLLTREGILSFWNSDLWVIMEHICRYSDNQQIRSEVFISTIHIWNYYCDGYYRYSNARDLNHNVCAKCPLWMNNICEHTLEADTKIHQLYDAFLNKDYKKFSEIIEYIRGMLNVLS